MKTWHWFAIAGGIILVWIFVEEQKTKAIVAAQGAPGMLNPQTSNAIVALGGGIGSVLTSIFGRSSGSKVTAPAGGNVAPGDATAWDPSGSAAAPPSTSPGDPFGIGPLQAPPYNGQASGGTNVGGGLTSAQNDPFGLQLTAPNFNVGSNGADFSN